MPPKNKDSILNRGAACLECRKRKLKCDAAKPHCGACMKSGREDRCIYEAIRNKNLADQLEERVNQLERMVERMEREGQQAGSSAMFGTPTGSGGSAGATPSGVPLAQSSSGMLTPLETFDHLPLEHLSAPLNLLSWDCAEESPSRLPDESHNFLLDTFMTYLPKSHLQVHPERFLHSLNLPEDDSRSIHPAMLSAIYLLACYHWSDSLSSYETAFLTQARSGMQNSLAKADRLYTGFIQPGILVTEYLLNRGRFREAYHQIIQTAQFAMDCHLHKLTTPIWRPGMPTGPGGLLPSPADSVELGERILAFWAIFILDQKCCIIMGLPSSFSKGDELDTRNRIDAAWPNSISEYETGQVAHSDSMTLRFLCTDGPPFILQDPSATLRMRLQSFALYRFAGDADMPPEDIDLAINQFLKRLPPPNTADQVNMPSVVLAHVVARAATVRLCARSSATQTMDDRALQASLGCAWMIHVLNSSDYDMWTLDIVLSYIWADCAKIVARHVKDKEQSGAVEESARLRPALSAILTGLSRAAQVYPIISSEVRMVESLVSGLSG